MPVPKPGTGEEQDKFINRCMSWAEDEHPEMTNESRLSMCYTSWRSVHGGSPPKESKPDQEYGSFREV
jgi:hypothetical protein